MTALDPATLRTHAVLAARLAEHHRRDGWKRVGINGAQGSGKTTLAANLVAHLRDDHALDALAISLDDFYLSRTARARLAHAVHPLLATRGVPGTHDVARGIECLERLRAGQPCRLPAFCKANDDVRDAGHERQIEETPDIVLIEGWCVATPPQEDAELIEPVNDLERQDDPDGTWRRYVNRQLAGPYARWFAALDALVFLQIPDWAAVRRWRAQQERETAAAHGTVTPLSDPAMLDRFLEHYQRLTVHALEELPRTADVVLRLGPAHEVIGERCAAAAPAATPG